MKRLPILCFSLLFVHTAKAQIFEANFDSDANNVAAYNFDGTPRTVSSVLGLNQPFGEAISKSNLFIANGGGVGEYTTSGGVVSASLVTGLNNAENIAVSGDRCSSRFSEMGLSVNTARPATS